MMAPALLLAVALLAASPAAASPCPPGLAQMAAFAYSPPEPSAPAVSLTVCEDLSHPNGSISFVPSAPTAAFPLTLNKTVYANTVEDDEAYLAPFTKSEVMNATTDIMGNKLLGIHGAAPRSAETTLGEVMGAIPPVRGNIGGARVWTANRWSAVDATFDPKMSNNGAGTPSPQEVSAVLTGLGSSAFDFEGLIGSDLPILLLNFPLKGSERAVRQAIATHNQRRALRAEFEVALEQRDARAASALQERLDALDDPVLDAQFDFLQNDDEEAAANCTQGTDCCYGLDLPQAGVKYSIGSASACSALCSTTHGCAAFVHRHDACWLKSAVKPADGHTATWSSPGYCMGYRVGPPTPAPPPGDVGAFWEMSVVPQQRETGKEQPVFFRFMQVNHSSSSSTDGDTAAAGADAPPPHTALYFDSFAYVPSWCASDTLADCDAPSNYYSAMLDTHFFWEKTWETEQRMELSLPERPADTDGKLLATQASYSLVLDMITRTGHEMWPRYGTAPGYEQPGIGADGFQEIFTATMMGALEWGMFGYAKGVLDNWLTYFIKDDGFVLYRGLEMAEHGRMLTNIAQYYDYTGDGELLLKHLDKIAGIGWLLNKRREAALSSYPPTDSRYGMPTGNDEADLFWNTVTGNPSTGKKTHIFLRH
jgi:hypothetical protein